METDGSRRTSADESALRLDGAASSSGTDTARSVVPEVNEPDAAHASEVAVGPDAAERELVARAVGGDRGAISEVVRLLQDPIYRLALRMVLRPADAEDACQEILLRVVGKLGTWRGEAKLLTWAYRIGVNYLLNLKRRTPQEQQQLSLDEFGEGLKDGLAEQDYRGPESALLTHEVRLNCSQAMLQCLAREERLAFVLSEIFELSSAEAAWISGTTAPAYRKRLERAKKRLGNFLTSTCGLANPQAFCRCSRRVEKAVDLGRIDPRRPAFAAHPLTAGGRTVDTAARQLTGTRAAAPATGGRAAQEVERQMAQLHDAAAVLGAHPDYAAPQAKMDAITTLLTSGRFPLLD
ncbi:RNA polymerase sigma factor [Nocardia sp. NBC_01327]|uniref:RNA polymerase sigma factor n=1 Tax=Nocardia sp. NBC_01327 TaxID=2903593 RepID=UPI002E0D9007|nr:RNA polymerase sigma factor [Nocardia sp. NBC_01327]